jgi:hypothetical protein
MKRDFLTSYMEYAQGNEASPLFHEWAGINVLSCVISRRVYFSQEYFKIYPNMYVVLVGEPGDKKTTAMSLAREMVQKMDRPIAPPSATKEAITVLMSAENDKSKCHINYLDGTLPKHITHLSFFASEIVTMLSAGGNPQGIIEFFTDIYDREAFEVLTKNKGNDVIDAPYITILACMTPEQTGQLLKERLITGGFSRRCVFIYGRSKAEPVPRPKLLPSQIEAKKFCMEHLQRVKEYKGEFKMTPCGEVFFDKWYRQKHRQLSMPHPAPFKNWLRSKDTMLIKLCMLLDLADEMTGTLSGELLERGVAMLDATEKDLNRVLAGAGKNPLAELAFKILSKLEEAPDKRLSKKQLLAALFEDGDLDQIDKAIAFLVTTEKVTKGVIQIPHPVEVLALKQVESS